MDRFSGTYDFDSTRGATREQLRDRLIADLTLVRARIGGSLRPDRGESDRATPTTKGRMT